MSGFGDRGGRLTLSISLPQSLRSGVFVVVDVQHRRHLDGLSGYYRGEQKLESSKAEQREPGVELSPTEEEVPGTYAGNLPQSFEDQHQPPPAPRRGRRRRASSQGGMQRRRKAMKAEGSTMQHRTGCRGSATEEAARWDHRSCFSLPQSLEVDWMGVPPGM
ncbi:hypothetical protein LTR09_006972 [Extremus antarcticus]|uniref:Uncharacterized protein n=1 Tax=Extremus antarcticus TaxID=702011 RepID=A0AAJ0G898_9PEZI|nr:hypothetical protein LTR09_006972 [Extremus antarcticus]